MNDNAENLTLNNSKRPKSKRGGLFVIPDRDVNPVLFNETYAPLLEDFKTGRVTRVTQTFPLRKMPKWLWSATRLKLKSPSSVPDAAATPEAPLPRSSADEQRADETADVTQIPGEGAQ